MARPPLKLTAPPIVVIIGHLVLVALVAIADSDSLIPFRQGAPLAPPTPIPLLLDVGGRREEPSAVSAAAAVGPSESPQLGPSTTPAPTSSPPASSAASSTSVAPTSTEAPSVAVPTVAAAVETTPAITTAAATTTAAAGPPRAAGARARVKFRCARPSDCLNGGICHGEMCFCQPGFSGESCAINIDECRQVEEPCFNNGTCLDDINQFRCSCQAGFRGDRCQEEMDMCAEPGPCQNGARCVNYRTEYACACEPGWEGRNCESNIDECRQSAEPCLNNGTCLDEINQFRCACRAGFRGLRCEQEIDMCSNGPCLNGAKCVNHRTDFSCECEPGWEGRNCEFNIDDCLAKHHQNANPCQNNATCVDLVNDFRCDCGETGFTGERCEERQKCFTKSVLELCNHRQAECVNVASSYECLISASFDGTGQNYATYKVHGRHKMREIYLKYRSLAGGVILSFETTSAAAAAATAAAATTAGGPHVVDLQLNRSGLYLGGAPIRRHENDMKFDELLDGSERELRLGLETPIEVRSLALGRQLAAPAGPRASSPARAAGAPFKGCLLQARLNNQLVPLLEYGAGPNLGAPANGSLELLEDRLEVGQCRTCFERDCLNGGRCEEAPGGGGGGGGLASERCACPGAFAGTFCELDVDECAPNNGLGPCLNGAACENLHGGHRCHCKEGFKGDQCQEIADYCLARRPCLAGGACTSLGAGPQQASGASAQAQAQAQAPFVCECPSSHIGRRCERRRDCLNECHPHHAHCVNNVTCACLPGARTERAQCEQVANCEQLPAGQLCLNGGQCVNNPPQAAAAAPSAGYRCVCRDNYHGPICQYLIERPKLDLLVLVVVSCVGVLLAASAVVALMIFRSVRKARATRGTYSPSTQEKFGNSACDLLKPPVPERLI